MAATAVVFGLTAAVFFAVGSVGGAGIDMITASAPCAVLTRSANGHTTLAVADPTLTGSSVRVTVGPHASVTIDLTQGPPGTSHEVTLPY